MPIDYAGLASSSLDAIREAGRKITWTRYSTAHDPVAQTVTPTVEHTATLDVVVLPAKKANAMAHFQVGFDEAYQEALRKGSARALLIAASSAPYMPIAGDEFEFDGQKWECLGCTPINPAGVAVIYKSEVIQK